MRLKLKFLKQSQISLAFKDGPRLWTSSFFLALFVAFIIHFIFAFLFQVDLGIKEKKFLPLSKAQVYASTTSTTTASISEKEFYPIISSLPRAPSPILTASLLPEHFTEEHAHLSFIPDSFSFNQTLGDPKLDHLKILISRGYRLKNMPSFALSDSRPCKAVVNFQACTKSGDLIWFEWIERTGNKQKDLEIEKILKQLQFELPKEPLFTNGTIEIIL